MNSADSLADTTGTTAKTAGRARVFAGALLVLGTLMPATMVITVIRRFVEGTWPGHEWLMHAFMAVNLLGSCSVGLWLTSKAEQRAQRKWFAAGLAIADGVSIILVALGPPMAVMLGLRFFQGAASVAAVSLLMGSIRGRASSPSSMGIIGAAVVVALVVGIPVGAIVGKVDPSHTLFLGGALGILSGLMAVVVFPGAWEAGPSRLSIRELWTRFADLRRPTGIVALERLGVGSMTVTLSLYAHHVLQVADSKVSHWFSVFLMVFAIAMWPISRISERVGSTRVLQGGAIAYAVMFLLLGLVPAGSLMILLVIGGIGSAALYGPALGLVAQSVPGDVRSSAMAVMNAAGTLGMFFGNAMALIVSQSLLSLGLERSTAYAAVFIIAGSLQLASLFLSRPRPVAR